MSELQESMERTVQLHELLKSESLASTIWRAALAHREQAPSSLKRLFNESAFLFLHHGRLPMGGVRDANRLTTALLKRNATACIRAVQVGSRLGFATTALWAHANSDLHKSALRVAALKGRKALPIEQLSASESTDGPPENWPALWVPEDLAQLASELAAQASVPLEQAKLMLYLVCTINPADADRRKEPAPSAAFNKEPAEKKSPPAASQLSETTKENPDISPSSDKPPGKELTHDTSSATKASITRPSQATTSAALAGMPPPFESALESIRTLDDLALEWNTIETFIEACRELALARSERLAARTERLTQALSALASPTARSALQRLKVSGSHEAWTPAHFPAATSHEAADNLEALALCLERVETAFNQPPPSTYEEMVDRAEKLKALHAEVDRHYGIIAKIAQLENKSAPVPTAPTTAVTAEELPPPRIEPQRREAELTTPDVSSSTHGTTSDGKQVSLADTNSPAIYLPSEKEATLQEQQNEPAELAIPTQNLLSSEAAVGHGLMPPQSASTPEKQHHPIDKKASAVTLRARGTHESREPTEEAPTAFGRDAARQRQLHLTRSQAAETFLSAPSNETLTAFLHTLILEGDIAGAYWVARAEEEQGREATVPSWLLEALAGSILLSGEGSLAAQGLFDIVATREMPSQPELRLLAVAAALPAALKEPTSGMVGWLEPPPNTPFLKPLIDAARDYAREGYALPDNVQGILTSEPERAERIKAVSAEVERWREQALLKRCGYVRATTVWTHLLRDSSLAYLLETAAEDLRDNLAQVDEDLRLWRDTSFIDNQIIQASSEKLGDSRPIIGTAYKWLHMAIKDACARVANWYQLARANEKAREGDWLSSRLQTLRRSFIVAAPQALEDISAWAAAEATSAAFSAAAALSRAIRLVASALNCTEVPPPPPLPEDLALVTHLLDDSSGLDSLLRRRLLLLPEVRLQHGRENWGSSLASVPPSLARKVGSPTSLVQCIEEWIEQRDFRFIDTLLAEVTDEAIHARLDERASVAIEESRRILKADLARARADVERAMVDGVLSETARVEVTEKLEALGDDRILDFGLANERLRTALSEIATAHRQGVERQRARWKDLRPRLLTTAWSTEQRDRASQRVEEVLAAEDYRSADELLSTLDESIDNQSAFDAALFAAVSEPPRHLESFIKVLPHFEQEMKTIKQRQAPGAAQAIVARVLAQAETRREVKDLFDPWMTMAKAKGDRQTALSHMPALLSHLGFRSIPNSGVPIAPDRDASDTRIVAMHAAVSATNHSPVPHFGSRVEGRLRVLCVWEQERADALFSIVGQLRSTDEGMLIVYFGRLGLARRRQLSLTCRRAGAAAVVLDEWLFLYLAAMGDTSAKLGAFFECALPFSAINPYSPRASASVPKEMFFGREEMAVELSSFDGTCLIYGGRQLGKSALLEHVERRFKEAGPDGGHVTVRLDIKDVGDPAADQAPEDLWPRLANELKRIHLLPTSSKGDKPDALITRITDCLSGNKPRKLLILLDEADNFLDADAKRNFNQVKRLRDLMMRNPGRCKVVLAGLHNVQRFQGIANQPLAHFGAAQLVGPLSPKDADALVRKPLASLGFRFAPEEKNGSVLRILSYTNYHPGLIQLFCRELVALLQSRGDPHQNPPYEVRETDVEEVYRRAETRKLIRDRFEWTVAVDERYQAVAWAMVIHHVFNHEDEDHGGYAESMSTNDLLSLVRSFWEAGFKNIDQEQMLGILVEMVGLGVLVRTAQGNYRLRSPNLVRLLGTGNEILARLDELSRRPSPRAAFDADHHHVKLDSVLQPRFSPLTYAQERQLTQHQSSVAIVLGSAATQADLLPIALDRIARQDRPDMGAFRTIPAEAAHKDRLTEWLRAFIASQPRECERMLCFIELAPEDAADGSLLEKAIAFCESLRSERRWLRVIFLMRPLAAWRMASGHAQRFLEDGRLLVLSLRRWTAPAIDRLLDEVEVRTADIEFRRRVLEVTTGGWPSHLTAFSKAVQDKDERRVATEMESSLKRGTPAGDEFWRQLELDGLPRVGEVLREIHGCGGIFPGTTFDGLLEGDLGALKGYSDRMLWVLQQFGCLETREGNGMRLFVERCVAEVFR